MKNKYLLLMLIAVFSLAVGCKSKEPALRTTAMAKNPYSNSDLLEHDTQGIITLRGISDEVTDRQEGVNGAHKKAIQHLFYMGFPGTDMKNPMIRKGKRVESENQAFFDEFWKTGYKEYITDNKNEYFGCSSYAANCVIVVSTFKLNYNILRRDLERGKILNKIGF